jgi:hypothetical protein
MNSLKCNNLRANPTFFVKTIAEIEQQISVRVSTNLVKKRTSKTQQQQRLFFPSSEVAAASLFRCFSFSSSHEL